MQNRCIHAVAALLCLVVNLAHDGLRMVCTSVKINHECITPLQRHTSRQSEIPILISNREEANEFHVFNSSITPPQSGLGHPKEPSPSTSGSQSLTRNTRPHLGHFNSTSRMLFMRVSASLGGIGR